MKCANCGTELEDGKLYCPKCGKEIQIVPDFEPEIEEKISGALAELSGELKSSGEQQKKSKPTRISRERIVYFGGGLALLCIIIIFFIGNFLVQRIHNVSYQLERAEAYAEKEQYNKAIEAALKAVDVDRFDMNARLKLGEYYLFANQEKNACMTFLDIINLDGENEKAYEELISVYEKNKSYDKINQLIRSSNSSKIVNTFTKYIANSPEFSYDQGTYHERIPIKLTANASGKIFYTLDGARPDELSEIYKTPIYLDNGVHTIQAYFVNEYGIQSELAVKTYHIELNMPHEPDVKLEEGVYNEPRLIKIQVPENEKVYYTVDGTEPNQDSISYNYPIALPMGDSLYKFISYSAEGAASQIVTKKYSFIFQPEIEVRYAVDLLVAGLKDRGYILEYDGSIAGKAGHNLYICSTAIAINQKSYYLIIEYYEDPTGIDTKTGNMYCVDAQSGQLMKASIDTEGNYSVFSF